MSCLKTMMTVAAMLAATTGIVAEDGSQKSDAKKTDAIVAKIKAAVKAGKLSPADAKAKMAAIKKASQAEPRKENKKEKTAGKGPDLEAIWAGLQDAVKAGKLTSQQAKAKMAAIKKAGQAGGKTTLRLSARTQSRWPNQSPGARTRDTRWRRKVAKQPRGKRLEAFAVALS